MDNQQGVVDQIVQNLEFDVEAVPKNKSIQANCISQSTPLNVKIKVRKKDEQKHHDVSWNTVDTPKTVQKVRLVNSDRTIMTFDVFMEAEFEKKPRKLHKQFFDLLRPGICLGAVDDDKNPYMLSSSYSANITEPTKATKSDGTLKQTFTLSKNVYQVYSVSTQQGGSKWLFGKCKPGGCLDPPFSEDKYSYKPSTRSGPEREEEEELLDEENVRSDVNSNKKPVILHDEESQSNGRHSSIFDSGLFKKKRRSSDKSTNTKLPDKTDSIVDIYHGGSSTNSASTRSNSIITYPPKTKNVPRTSDDKTVRSTGPSEDKPRRSFNDHSEPCFIPPKGVNRIKATDTLDPSDNPKPGLSDDMKLRHSSLKESFKMPAPLPISIPVPIPIMSSTRKPKEIDPNDDILARQGDNANVTELPKKESQEQELLEKMNLRDSATSQLLREKISNMESFSSNVEQPTAPNELGDKNMVESNLQPFEETDSEKNMEDTRPPNKNEKLELPVPNPPAAAVDSETTNENLKTSDMNLAQSKQSYKTPITKYKHFEDSKDMQKNIDPENRSIENEATSNATPKPQYSYIESDELPKDYLRTRGGLEDQESDTENQESDTENQENDTVTILPIIAEIRENRDSTVEEITESNDKPTKQNDINYEDIAATKDKPKKDERKDSQGISQSKLPVLLKSMSLLSGSKTSTASAKDKRDIKRGDNPEKHSDKVEGKSTDLGSLLSGRKTSTASAKAKMDTKRGDSPDKYSDKVGDKGTDLGSLLDGSKTSTASAKAKRDTKRGDSPDTHSDKDGDKGTDLGSVLSGSKTSTASAKDKRDPNRSDSPDKHSGIVGDKGTDLESLLNGSKTSTASAKDKRDIKRGDSPDKHSDKDRDKGTDLGSVLSGSKTSTASAKDKRDPNRSDSPDKHSGIVGEKGTNLESLLNGSKTSTASAKDKRDPNKSDSPDKHSGTVGDKGTDLGSLLSGNKTSTASAKAKSDIRRGDRPEKHSDKFEGKGTDLGSLLNGSKTSTASAKAKRDTKRGDSPDTHSDKDGDKGTDLGALLSGSKTSTASAKNKRDTKRGDSPDKHSDKVGDKGTDLGSLLGGSKTSTASAKAKRDTKRGDSLDKHSDKVGDKGTDLGSLLGGSKTSTGSAKAKRDTKRGDSPDNHSGIVGDKGTDLGSLLSGSKTSTGSAKDKRDPNRSDSPDKHSGIVGDKGTDLGSLLGGSKTSTASAKAKRDTKRGDSPEKHSDKFEGKGTDLGSLLSGSKTSTASAKNKRDIKRGDSPDTHSDKDGDKGTDLGSLLSGSKTSTASAKNKRDTKRGDSPDKHSDKFGDKGTDLGSLLGGSKTSTASAKAKRYTKRGDSPDKHSDKDRGKGTDLGSVLSGSKTSTASAKDKRDPNRSDSPDKHSGIVGDKGTDLESLLNGSKTSTASVKDKTDTKRGDSPDKPSDKVGDKSTDLGSLLSGSKISTASAKDNRDKKRSFSPDKYLNIVVDRDTDLSVRTDGKRTSLPSGPKHETDSGDGKITEPLSDKENVGKISEPKNDGNIDSYTKGQARFPNEENVNFIAAPVIIDNTKQSPKSGKLKEVDSETKILDEPMNIDREYDPSGIPFTTQITSIIRESDGDDETQSTLSHELIGTQSVIYDTDELIPSTSAQKHTKRIPQSDKRVDSRLSIQSTSTLKSAMKKDLISVDLGFHSYINDKNERILRTFDAANSPTRLSNDSVTVLKTQMRISSNEIRIPVDSEHDMSIQIKKSNANQRVSISESGFMNNIDDSRVKKQGSPVLSSDVEIRSSEAEVEEKTERRIESDATVDHFTEYYEQELVPLQLIIKNLRNEIDILAAQQVVFKDKLFCPNNALFAQNKPKLPRLVHSNKKCYGCVRK